MLRAGLQQKTMDLPDVVEEVAGSVGQNVVAAFDAEVAVVRASLLVKQSCQQLSSSCQMVLVDVVEVIEYVGLKAWAASDDVAASDAVAASEDVAASDDVAA